MGGDNFCSQAPDLYTCQQLADRCQPAFKETENPNAVPEFEMCIANPDSYSDDPEAGDSTSGDTSTGDGSTTDGGTSTGDGSTTDGSAPVDPALDPARPSLSDAVRANCQNLDPKYMVIRKELLKKENSGKKKESVVMAKVKVCHATGNGSAHSIVIACPALKAHLKHQSAGDYIGACEI